MRILLYKSKALSSSLVIEAHLAPALDLFRRTLLLQISLASISLMFDFVPVLVQLEPQLATTYSSWDSAAFHQPQLGHKVPLLLTFLIHSIFLPFKAKSQHMTSIQLFNIKLITLGYQMLRWWVLLYQSHLTNATCLGLLSAISHCYLAVASPQVT